MGRTERPEQVQAPALRSIIKMIDMAIENGSLNPQDRDEVIQMFISGPTTVVDNKAGGGMMNIDEMTRPIFGYREFGEVGIREKIYDMLAPNEKMSDEELRLQNINPDSVLAEERPQAEGRPEGVLQGIFGELFGGRGAEGSDLSSMAATEILKLDEEIKLLRIDEMLNPGKDNSKAIQGKMNLREYYESLGN